ncbi:MAG: AAA family ATPase [bacterium]
MSGAATEILSRTLCIGDLATAKRLPMEFLEALGLSNVPRGVEIPYAGINGECGRARLRTALSAGDGSEWVSGAEPIIPYGLQRLSEARADGSLLICEGESDCWTLWHHGFPALGIPGNTQYDKLKREYLEGIDEIFVCHDSDNAGTIFVSEIVKKLAEFQWKGKAYQLHFREHFGVKDASDLHIKNSGAFPRELQGLLDKLRSGESIYPERRLRVVTGEELLNHKFPDREIICHPWLPSQGLAMIHGPTGAGKTFLGLALANAITSGGRFLKFHCPRPRRVLYLDAEMIASMMKQRYASILAGSDIEPPSPDYFKILTPDMQTGGLPNLSTRTGQNMIEPYLEGVEVLFIDHISGWCRTGDENCAESWTVVQDWVLHLRRKGLSVILFHHDGKESRPGGRGTIRRLDVLDTCIALKRPTNYEAEEGLRVEILFEKHRGFSGPDARPFEATMTMDGYRAVWSWKESDADLKEQVAELTERGLSVRAIAEELGLDRNKVQRLRKGLQKP